MSDYRYIGKDGKTVLARDLEDERDALRARLKEVEAERAAITENTLRIYEAWEATKTALATARRDALLDCHLIATEALTGDADGRDIYARIDALIAQEEPTT